MEEYVHVCKNEQKGFCPGGILSILTISYLRKSIVDNCLISVTGYLL